MELVFDQYIRKPFTVTAVEITESNIAEIASLVGELQTEETGAQRQFIRLARRIVPNVGRAYVGWFVTKLGDNYRCYSPKVFHDQFMTYASPVAWTFGDEDVVEQMDKHGWNYHMDQLASRLLPALASSEDIEAEDASYLTEDQMREAADAANTMDVDHAPPHGIERVDCIIVDEEILQPREDVIELIGADIPSVDYRPEGDEEKDAAPVDAQPGVVARKRNPHEGFAVD